LWFTICDIGGTFYGWQTCLYFALLDQVSLGMLFGEQAAENLLASPLFLTAKTHLPILK
jgi:hypothetical protein